MKNQGLDQEDAKRILKELKWTVIDGEVYDITYYISDHPGGVKKILRGVSIDSTEMFHRYHPGLKISKTTLTLLKIGEIPHLKPVLRALPVKVKK